MIVQIGKYAIQIDEEDLPLLAKEAGFQVQRRDTKNFERYYVKARNLHKRYLHVVIMNPPAGFDVDHINGDGRDNRRCNLRLVSRSQNMANQRRPVGASGYRGVLKAAHSSNWTARIQVEGRQHCRFGFPTAEQAARARDEMALAAFGDFAVLNFPEASRAQAADPFAANKRRAA